MDKTLPSPSRENYEELDGLSEEEIESRVVYVKITPLDQVVDEATKILSQKLEVK